MCLMRAIRSTYVLHYISLPVAYLVLFGDDGKYLYPASAFSACGLYYLLDTTNKIILYKQVLQKAMQEISKFAWFTSKGAKFVF
jgi:hypothetical protein